MSETAAAPADRDRAARAVALLGIAAALIFRALFLAEFRENPDTHAYRQVASIVARGSAVWAETTHYNYSPVWAWTLGALALLADTLGVSLSAAVLGLLQLSDLATAFLLFAIARDRLGLSPWRAGAAAALFLANPIAVLCTSLRGMFDSLAIFFLLLALHAVNAEKPRRLASTLWLSVSLLVKHIAWFHPLLFAWRRRREDRIGLPAFFSYVLFFASFFPYLAVSPAIIRNVFLYRGMGEAWGTEFLRFLPGFPVWGTSAIFVVATFLAVWLLSRVEILRASLMLFLVTLLFLPGITPYYLVWPIALGSLFGGLGYAIYTVIATGLFLASSEGLGVQLSNLPGWGGTWFATAFWLLWEIRRLGKRYPPKHVRPDSDSAGPNEATDAPRR